MYFVCILADDISSFVYVVTFFQGLFYYCFRVLYLNLDIFCKFQKFRDTVPLMFYISGFPKEKEMHVDGPEGFQKTISNLLKEEKLRMTRFDSPKACLIHSKSISFWVTVWPLLGCLKG